MEDQVQIQDQISDTTGFILICGSSEGEEGVHPLPPSEVRAGAGLQADSPPLALSAPRPPLPLPLGAGCGQEARASSEVGTCLLSSCFVPLP